MPRLGSGIPLVARRGELAGLTEALLRVRDGRAGAVLVSGDAGVGKSRLLEELITRAGAEGYSTLSGRCVDVGEASLPYLPFSEIVSQLAAEYPQALQDHPALRGLLPGTAGAAERDSDDRQLGQLQLFDAMHSALAGLAEQNPVLVTLEDLHWADRSSRDLLLFLLSRLGSQRLCIVATYRADDLHRRHPLRPMLAALTRLGAVQRLDLQPFGPRDALTFVQALADESLTDATMRMIAQRCEGNPFFAEELVSASTDSVPSGLADVLLARVEQLSAATQQVLRLAAVVGRRVDHERLRATSGLSEADLETALREAVTHNVLVADGSSAYSFRHALLREAVYADLLPGERARLHGVIAAALAGGAPGAAGTAAELAHHSMESHDLAGALAASVQAAEAAEELRAPAEALRHLDRALELWNAVPADERPAGTDEIALTRWAAWTAATTGDPEQGIALGRRAVELSGDHDDPIVRSQIHRRLAQHLLEIQGREHEALAAAEQALDLLKDSGNGPEKAWALAILARVNVRLDRPDAATEAAEAAVRTARASPGDHGTTAAEADALITLAVCAEGLGESEQARARLMEAVELAKSTGALGVELRAHFNRGTSFLDEGSLAEAVEAFGIGEARAAATGLTWSNYGLELRVAHVITRFMRGDWDEAEAAAELANESVSVHVATRVSVAGLLTAVARGRLDAVERRLVELEDVPVLDDQVDRLVGLCGAEAALWRDRPDQAVERLAVAQQKVRVHEDWPIGEISLCAVAVGANADLATQANRRGDSSARDAAVAAGEGQANRAAEVATKGQPRSAEMGPEGRAWLVQVDAELTRLRGESDPGRWAAVVDAFGYGEPYRQAQARWRWAEAALEQGDRDVAAEQIAAALDTADGLGAQPLAATLRALAKRGRIALRPGGRPGKPGEARDEAASNLLTPRERSVLTLVATGRTNRQIGTELFISEKTVSVHLSRVMAKLGVTSRTEAVSAAYARGMLR